MFIKNYHLLFFCTLLLGSILAVSASSWFTAWVGLEINLMSMIPLMLISLNSSYTEASIKYFLTQAMASLILIFSASLLFFSQKTLLMEILELLIIYSVVLKAGMAPLHFWFPQIISGLSWVQSLIMFTWQKVAPLILLCSFSSSIVIPTAIMSAIVGCLGGFNQMNLKILMTYSSISHSGWMLLACLMNLSSWLTYFLIYSILSSSIVLFLDKNSCESFSDIYSSSDSMSNKTILSINLLSLGGLPPLLGFSAKLTIIILSFNVLTLMFIPLIFSSLVSLFFYSRLIYSNLLNISNKNNFMLFTNKKYTSLLYTFTFTLNILSPFLFILS